MWETYSWECWHDRPKFEKLSLKFSIMPFKWKILAVFALILWYVWQIVKQIIYFITLPFAFINEAIRDWEYL